MLNGGGLKPQGPLYVYWLLQHVETDAIYTSIINEEEEEEEEFIYYSDVRT